MGVPRESHSEDDKSPLDTRTKAKLEKWLVSYDIIRLAKRLIIAKHNSIVAQLARAEELKNQVSTAESMNFSVRARFYAAVQVEGESYSEWAHRLRDLADPCDFKTILDEMLRDRFLMGMLNGPDRERLLELELSELTFDKVVDMANTFRSERTVSSTNPDDPLKNLMFIKKCTTCGLLYKTAF